MRKKRSKTVKVTSIFPANRKTVHTLLQSFDILRQITYPYITFKPLNEGKDFQWEIGKTFVFKTKLLGFIPFGTHRIKIIEFNDHLVRSNETNTFVKVWNHDIILREVGKNFTEYTDRVEIRAGIITNIVYIWANSFYRHRQDKWIKILKKRHKNKCKTQ